MSVCLLGSFPKKNAALIWTLSIRGGGGGSEANQKFWDTFCEPKLLEIFVERGWGFDQIQKFWDTFCQNIGWIRMHKSVPKVPKVLTFGKVYQKIQKSGGGSDLFWTKSKLKLHFFGGKLPYRSKCSGSKQRGLPYRVGRMQDWGVGSTRSRDLQTRPRDNRVCKAPSTGTAGGGLWTEWGGCHQTP